MLWHGKNFRGFLNKASQVLFNKTGTTLNSTNVQDAICEINSNLTQLAVGKRSILNLSGYTAASLLDSVSNDTAIRMTYATTAQRLSDLPISSGGAYIIFNTYSRVLVFLGWDGDVYYYISGGSGWHQIH